MLLLLHYCRIYIYTSYIYIMYRYYAWVIALQCGQFIIRKTEKRQSLSRGEDKSRELP